MAKRVNIKFEAKKRKRIHRYFWGVCLIEETDNNLWWNTTIKKWEPYRDNKKHGYSTHAPCKTLKAFKRMLRKFPEINGKCCLVNRYKGLDVYG